MTTYRQSCFYRFPSHTNTIAGLNMDTFNNRTNFITPQGLEITLRMANKLPWVPHELPQLEQQERARFFCAVMTEPALCDTCKICSVCTDTGQQCLKFRNYCGSVRWGDLDMAIELK